MGLQVFHTLTQILVGNYEGTVKSDNGQDDAGITQDFDFPEFTEGSYGKLPNHRKHNLKFNGARVK